jgi:FkbM family methyltransferase
VKALLSAVRRQLPGPVRAQIHRIGTFFGDEFVRPAPQFGEMPGYSIETTLTHLRDWGFQPATIVDVGAFRGDWTRLAKRIFPSARVLMVEAQDSLRPNLAAVCSYYRDVTYEPALLAACSGQTVDFVEMGTGSSVLEEASATPRLKVPKQTTTLDEIVESRGFQRIDLLKLDVQGYELEVLKGAERLLPACEFVLLEASLIPINRGCSLIADIFAFMTERRFRLLDICSQVRRKDGALWQTDLMFVNERSRFIPVAELNADNW